VVKIANEEAVARKWRRVLDFGDWCQHPLFQNIFLQRPPNKNPPDDKADTPRQKLFFWFHTTAVVVEFRGESTATLASGS